MKKENRFVKDTYTRDEIDQMFHTEVSHFIEDGKRTHGRKDSKKDILKFAEDLYFGVYKEFLHKSVLDKYK